MINYVRNKVEWQWKIAVAVILLVVLVSILVLVIYSNQPPRLVDIPVIVGNSAFNERHNSSFVASVNDYWVSDDLLISDAGNFSGTVLTFYDGSDPLNRTLVRSLLFVRIAGNYVVSQQGDTIDDALSDYMLFSAQDSGERNNMFIIRGYFEIPATISLAKVDIEFTWVRVFKDTKEDRGLYFQVLPGAASRYSSNIPQISFNKKSTRSISSRFDHYDKIMAENELFNNGVLNGFSYRDAARQTIQ